MFKCKFMTSCDLLNEDGVTYSRASRFFFFFLSGEGRGCGEDLFCREAKGPRQNTFNSQSSRNNLLYSMLLKRPETHKPGM